MTCQDRYHRHSLNRKSDCQMERLRLPSKINSHWEFSNHGQSWLEFSGQESHYFELAVNLYPIRFYINFHVKLVKFLGFMCFPNFADVQTSQTLQIVLSLNASQSLSIMQAAQNSWVLQTYASVIPYSNAEENYSHNSTSLLSLLLYYLLFNINLVKGS